MRKPSTGLKQHIIDAVFRLLVAIPPLHRWANRRLINRYAYAAPVRPRPLSMAADYPTWRGLTDRRYSGRHLPRQPIPDLPPVDQVVELFRRTEDRRATDTALLFPFFAQWFTDSFLRTKFKTQGEPDYALNESNHEIDLCQIYGVGEAQTRMLRALEGGRLKSQSIDGEEFPDFLFEEANGSLQLKSCYAGLYTQTNFDRVFGDAPDEHKRHAFAVGLEHGNSTMGNTLMNVLFFREHNRVAGVLAAAYPGWDDERLFQTARNICIVELLQIVLSDYIVHIAPLPFPLKAFPGDAEKESWYRTNWIAVEFALLYRWHDLIPETVTFGGDTRPSGALRRNNRWLLKVGIDQALLDASAQKAGWIGLGNTSEFLLPVKKLSVEMGRGCDLPPFNAYREHFGMEPVADFDTLTRSPALAAKLRELYGSIDRLEWFVGIFAEAYDEAD